MAYLKILSGEESQDIELKNGRYTIGRGDQAHIQIFSDQISRQHVDLIVEGNQVTLIDRGSANGTAVNGRFITTSNLHSGDQILLGDIMLEYINPEATSRSPIRASENDARTSVVAATRVIADKLRPKSLMPLFSLAFALCFLGLSLVTSFSYEHIFKQKTELLALDRAHDLVRYLAEKNKIEVKEQNELLVDVESIKKENGVTEAMILDRDGRVIAPVQYRNKIDRDPRVQEALAHNSDQKILPSNRSASGTYTLVHPIRYFDAQLGTYKNIGVAKIIFSPELSLGAQAEMKQLKVLLFISAAGLAILLGWLLTKTLSLPIKHLAESIHKWRSGQRFQKEEVPFKDWAPLYEAIDLAIEDAKNQRS